ncbi:hypothetical protein Tco_1372982, partial [Tanacetum coccineum]
MAKAVTKFGKGTITLRSGKSKISFYRIPESSCKIEKGVKNDIEPITPIMTVNGLVVEWEEKKKLHLEKEMKFNQWRNNNFKSKHPAPVKVVGGMDDEGEVTSENDILTFDGAVQLNTIQLKKSTNIIRSWKIGIIWSLSLLGICKRCKNESRNDWFIDLEKTIEADIGEHSLNAVGFVIELIHDSALVNAMVFDWFIELSKDGREFGYFEYFKDIGFSAR